MKRIIHPIAVAGLLFAASCSDAPKADQVTATDSQAVNRPAAGAVYKADLAQSHVDFVGTKPTGHHSGTFSLSEGTLNVANGAVSGGKFVINMKSMKILDTDTSGSTKLARHLMSPDFFDVQKDSTARFEITAVTTGIDTSGGKKVLLEGATHTITGNLTLKGQTKSIAFPARISVSDASVTADASFNIDRTQWGVNYQSPESMQNAFISHDVNITPHIVATK